MIYYIADTHFGHNSVLKFDDRSFEKIEEHDRCLMENWNARIQDRDDVNILGDFAYRNEKPEE